MIYSFQVPVALAVQYVNCTVINEEPLTIIDPGARGQNNLKLIEKELNKIGRSIPELKRILLTHGHVDHFGISEDLKDLSGAEIYLHPHDFNKAVANSANQQDYKDLLLKNGCHNSQLKVIDDFLNTIQQFTRLLENPRPMPEQIGFKNSVLQVIETPGHTSGSVVFYYAPDQVLMSGDTVIKKITPNPVAEFNADRTLFHSLAEFKKSMAKLEKLTVKKIIPGHGEMLDDFSRVYAFYQKNWEFRENAILQALKTKKKASAYDIATMIFREFKDFNLFLAISEIVGYFDDLELQGKIKLFETEGLIKAELTEI